MADYATVDQIRARLDITGTTYDAVLADLATAASRWVDRYCRLPADAFAVATDSTRYYSQDDIDRDGILHLRAPLAQVTQIVNGDGTTLTSSQYRLLPRNRIGPAWAVETIGGTTWSFSDLDSEIQVTGRWGYSVTPPNPVVEATAMLAAWMFKRYQGALQDRFPSPDLGEMIYSEAMPKQVRALLETYQWLTV